MNRDFDQDLPRVYELFDRNHNRLRAELMSSLEADWEPTALTRHRSDRWRHSTRWIAIGASLAACVALVILARSSGTSLKPAAASALLAPGDLGSTDPSYVILEKSSLPNAETAVCKVLPIFNPS